MIAEVVEDELPEPEADAIAAAAAEDEVDEVDEDVGVLIGAGLLYLNGVVFLVKSLQNSTDNCKHSSKVGLPKDHSNVDKICFSI